MFFWQHTPQRDPKERGTKNAGKRDESDGKWTHADFGRHTMTTQQFFVDQLLRDLLFLRRLKLMLPFPVSEATKALVAYKTEMIPGWLELLLSFSSS
jgi:hypothetical protein